MEKRLKAIKRKREDPVFNEFEASLEDLRFRKTYCEEVEEKQKKKASSTLQTSSSSSVSDHPSATSTSSSRIPSSNTKTICDLPSEILAKLFGYLIDPRDLLRAARVNKRWNESAFQPKYWKTICPIQWARGDWSFQLSDPLGEGQASLRTGNSSLASSTESLNSLPVEPALSLIHI